MRDYARICSGFWTGHTGRLIRGLGPEARVVSLYLLSGPAANMIGLYYLPIPTLCHETGLSEKAALKALRSLSEVQFAEYDPVSEMVWIPNMARYQIADQLHPNDKQCKGVWRELSRYRNTKYFKAFYERYQTTFHLPATDFSAPLEPPFQPPSKPLRSQDQDQNHDQEHEQNQDQELGGQVKALAARPKGEKTWDAYRDGYRKLYGVEPVRNAKVNSQICQLVDRLGAEEAPQVAAFYLAHKKQIYASNRHPVSLLLRDAEGIRTDFLTKRAGTSEQTAPKTMAEWCALQGGAR